MDVADVPAFAVRETNQTGPPTPRLLDRVRDALRPRHDSRRTEKAYVAWIRRSIHDVSTTMIYTHILNRGPAAVRSPADRMFTP